MNSRHSAAEIWLLIHIFHSQVTKSKTWKDIAGLLGIGASSSAAYTLRKHYTKNLFAFECHFDRGGVDPTPIIQQVEAGSKKKGTKAASVPSPGNFYFFSPQMKRFLTNNGTTVRYRNKFQRLIEFARFVSSARFSIIIDGWLWLSDWLSTEFRSGLQ